MMNPISEQVLLDGEATVAQWATVHPGAWEVFLKHDIDFCCGGHTPLAKACYSVGIPVAQLVAEVKASDETQPDIFTRMDSWSSPFLIDFIVETHHRYIRRAGPELLAMLAQVCERHGSDHPELVVVRERVLDLVDELLEHMEKEEKILFPALRELALGKSQPSIDKRRVIAPIAVMEDEHETAGQLVKDIRLLTNGYAPPAHACQMYQFTYQRLKEFDGDLMRHVHLENNILFQRFKPSAVSSPIF